MDAVHADHGVEAVLEGNAVKLRSELPVPEVPCAVEVVLQARAADGGEIGVAVDVEFDLAFAPPAVGFDTPVHIGADVVAVALDVIQNGVVFFIGQGIDPAELGVEIEAVRGDLLFLAIDLIIHPVFPYTQILQLHPEALEIGHLKIAVMTSAGIDADQQTAELTGFKGVSIAEEVR